MTTVSELQKIETEYFRLMDSSAELEVLIHMGSLKNKHKRAVEQAQVLVEIAATILGKAIKNEQSLQISSGGQSNTVPIKREE